MDLFPLILIPEHVHLRCVQICIDETVTVTLCSEALTAVCPVCGQESQRIHSRYQRKPRDLPLSGRPVRFIVALRRFFALPHQNLPLSCHYRLSLPGSCSPYHEDTSVLKTSGQTSTQAFYSFQKDEGREATQRDLSHAIWGLLDNEGTGEKNAYEGDGENFSYVLQSCFFDAHLLY